MKRKTPDNDGNCDNTTETGADTLGRVMEEVGVSADNSDSPTNETAVTAVGTLETSNAIQDVVPEQSTERLPVKFHQPQMSKVQEDQQNLLAQQQDRTPTVQQKHHETITESEKNDMEEESRSKISLATSEATRRYPIDGDPKMKLAQGSDPEWNEMLFQLVHYKAIHGDLRPKAKDDEFKPLHDWMVAQRKEFKIYQETPEKSYLTADQLKVLDHLQFPWNTRGDEHWFRNYEHLKQFCQDHGHCMVPRTFVDVPNLCHWVTDQRRQLKNAKSGKPSTMTKDRQRLLDEIEFVWQIRNRTTWDTRFLELVDFKKQNGTTVVPQRKLGAFQMQIP